MKIIIIGGGPGGYETAVAAAKKGLEVTLISAGPLGGTCLNVGCIPTKCFCHDAKAYSLSRENASGELGTPADDASSLQMQAASEALRKMVERKNGVVAQLRAGVETLLKGVEVVRGIARVADSRTVRVWPTEDEMSSDPSLSAELSEYKEYTADRIIIATGSHPSWLKVPGAATTPGVVGSSEILSLQKVPRRLTVIGGGVIGVEFAGIFAALGSKVTIIEYCKNILPNMDADVSKRLKQALMKKGITILTGAEVTAISSAREIGERPCPSEEVDGTENQNSSAGGEQIQIVSYKCGEKTESVVSDKVLMAVGRTPDMRVILGCKGIESTRRGIVTDENMQTSLPGVYAVGDVNGRTMLAHAAIAEGRIALEHILNSLAESDEVRHSGGSRIRLDIMPSAVFTSPELASVGLTEEQCKERGIAYKARKSFYRSNGKALAEGETEGLCKILIAEPGQEGLRDGQILGAHILGADAANLVSEITALMNFRATASDLSNIIHPHPTISEIIGNCVSE